MAEVLPVEIIYMILDCAPWRFIGTNRHLTSVALSAVDKLPSPPAFSWNYICEPLHVKSLRILYDSQYARARIYRDGYMIVYTYIDIYDSNIYEDFITIYTKPEYIRELYPTIITRDYIARFTCCRFGVPRGLLIYARGASVTINPREYTIQLPTHAIIVKKIGLFVSLMLLDGHNVKYRKNIKIGSKPAPIIIRHTIPGVILPDLYEFITSGISLMKQHIARNSVTNKRIHGSFTSIIDGILDLLKIIRPS